MNQMLLRLLPRAQAAIDRATADEKERERN